MEENRDAGHGLQGPHRVAPLDLPTGFVALRLAMQPEGPTLEMGQPSILVGRHTGVDLRLPAPEVSRRHCRLFFDEGFWRLQDLRSLNGVYVNNDRVYETTLYDGDLLRIGDFVFRVAYIPCEKASGRDEMIQSIADVLPRAS